MLGKPDLRHQCKLAIDLIPDEGLGEALESLRAIVEFGSESQSITLSDRDRDRFLAALDDDEAKPNEALIKAFERYKAATGE